MKLSVALAVYNEEANMKRCLASVADIADEIIIVDGGSSDKSVEIAKQFTRYITITDNPPIFHINKQKALDMCHGEWILQLDADEVLDAKLKEEIKETIAAKNAKDGYYIPRRNYFLGDWLRKGGQYPDYVIRLFRSGKGRFPQKSVHEQIEISGTVGHLRNPLDHYSYTSIPHYWKKAYIYIQLSAREKGISAFGYLFMKPIGTFLSIYIRHKGFVDGWRGFLFALFSALHFPKIYLLSRYSRPI